ncbi:50S ribosomal protein L3 [Methanocella sp. CWC-04]|uniref:Large ribosomal subunit protein uL3 n=1 Tax=Methanooceanicella nereidis TaxID=2052831 RepID=A0AAP2RAD6_9EURY|nr:50S ribosomal protein L3 [Methanocella sp. CWC-04]MCD1293514.1 50S ribosomal protein L3 [Methanocella sp. CWC-04]
MGHAHAPRRGSLGFSPRVRARSQKPKYRSWAELGDQPRIQGFVGFKAGMSHIIMIDDRPKSNTEGMEISVPVTIVETPVMKVAGIRVYNDSPYGKKVIAEAWTNDFNKQLSKLIKAPKNGYKTEDELAKMEEFIKSGVVADLRVMVFTETDGVTGIPKKVPELMENRIGGGDMAKRFEFAKSLLGKQVGIKDVFAPGELVDVSAITKGKGTKGPVTRWGVAMQKRKHARTGKKRHIGNLGPWNPHRVRWQVPQLGQTGFHQRTEYNKRIIKFGDIGQDITPAGGFSNYGVVRNEYILLKGSIPGPVKRMIRIRPAVRPKDSPKQAPEILYTSKLSKQGCRR